MPANAWVELPVTNQYNPSTYVVTGAVSNLEAPAGTSFVRYQLLFFQPPSNPAGSVYFDQLSLVQSGVISPTPPQITTISPDGSVPFLSAANVFAFTVSSPGAVSPGSVKVLLNGLDVSSQLLFGGSPDILNVTLPGIAPNAVYTISITATNASGGAATNLTFDTFNQAGFTIEAEDFDFSSGQFIDNPVPTASSAANSYYGQIGVDFIDENYLTYAGTHLFRPADHIATEVTSDYLRQAYYLAQQTNPVVPRCLAELHADGSEEQLQSLRPTGGRQRQLLCRMPAGHQRTRDDIASYPTAWEFQRARLGLANLELGAVARDQRAARRRFPGWNQHATHDHFGKCECQFLFSRSCRAARQLASSHDRLRPGAFGPDPNRLQLSRAL
jgi:hypothetical protein